MSVAFGQRVAGFRAFRGFGHEAITQPPPG